ncbi:RidA family protein [Streptomyces sp. CA-249302]|uniref:RidA family protein n=1 Tax=Streptomyces sp. CA-249302 TaxID=3240058 RepID=UPI003D9219E9
MTQSVTKREIVIPELSDPVSHYAHAVSFGNLVFISGVVGHDPQANTVSSDVTEQARQLFVNLGKVLDAVGASPADILKVNVYLTDVSDHVLVTPVRADFFGPHLPASTLVEVKGLIHPSLKVEIDAVVGLPEA